MKRHAKSLQKKSKGHEVSLGKHRGTFKVKSGTSKKDYTVWAFVDGGFGCSCKWGIETGNRRGECSHCLKVRQWLENAGNRSLSFWASEKAADRQHRPTEQVSTGLWQTSRKRRMPARETGYPMPAEPATRGRSKLFMS